MSGTLNQTHRRNLTSRTEATGTEPALYVALEGQRALSGGLRASLAGLDEIHIGRGMERAFRIASKTKAVLVIPDPRMSSQHTRLFREDGTWLVEDMGSTNGTFVDGTRVTQVPVEESAVITLGATCLLFEPAEAILDSAPTGNVDTSSLGSRPRGMASLVPAVEQHMPRLLRVAMSKLSILLLGETGAGKEVLARTIHQLSGRTGAFVAINCGALAPTLVESQLFGYVKGAFSGALRDEPGLVRSSAGGTLFLDEIGELPPGAQATLLRVLQENEVLPVGGTKPIPVDLRVLAATLKPIDEGASFRPDLYARIAAFVHRLTPLRERRGDLGLILADLLPRLAPDRASAIRIAPDLGTALVSHGFPLNVRELEQLMSVALVTSGKDVLTLESIGDALKGVRSARQQQPTGDWREATKTSPTRRALTDDEKKLKDELVAVLTKTKGNVSEIARSMGKTRMQIHRWMKRFGLDPETFRG